MIELIFKIIVKKEMSIDLTIDEIRKFPTHKSLYYLFDEKMIIVEYKPIVDMDHQGFKKLLIDKFKKQYNAHSVVLVSREIKEIDP